MTHPGIQHGMYTADGLEHNPHGTPSSAASDHLEQLDKRLHKLNDFDFGDHWAEISGDGEFALLTWGSTNGAVQEAAGRLRTAGYALRVIAVRLLMPLNRDALLEALDGCSMVWVVEQNHQGQLFHYLKAEDALPPRARSLAKPGPLPFRPGELVSALIEEFAE